MPLFWRIRYLDSRDRQFKDRDLFLDTDSLDAATKAAVEAIHELRSDGYEWRILQFRDRFHENQLSRDELNELCRQRGGMSSFSLPSYFEDENGKELTSRQMGFALTGDANAMMFPAGTPPHDVQLALSDNRPIPLDKISFSEEDLNVLYCFVRDLREMLASAFLKDGPGTLTDNEPGQMSLQTAVTDEELRSFVMVFRKLYMTNETGNFLKAVAVFGEALHGHPWANWVMGIGREYTTGLEASDFVSCAARGRVPFSRKRLIDVHLYTQYAHQPDKRRTRQFKECLSAVANENAVLKWLFLTEIWKCALLICNAGRVIAFVYEQHCRFHEVSPDTVASIATDYPGLGKLEKKQDREERILRDKEKELAEDLWKEAGCPPNGPERFIEEARRHLKEALGRQA